MFGAVYAVDGSAIDIVMEVAREFSPRIEIDGPRALDVAGGKALDTPQVSTIRASTAPARQVVLDLSGMTRLFGDARAMGEALRRAAADRGLRVRVAIAGTRTAARLLACAASEPVTVVDPGAEATTLAPLPIQRLAVLAHDEPAASSSPRTRTLSVALPAVAVLATFRRWGLRTLGEVAALPASAVAARLGQAGVRWQRRARGEDSRPLLPVVPEERFEQALELEWPIEGLEPLSCVLGRLLEPLEAHLERRGRSAAVPARPAASRDAGRTRALATVAGADAGRAHPSYPGAARSGITSSGRGDRSRGRGRRPDAGTRPPVFAVHTSAPVTRSDLHAHGAARRADGGGTLWFAGPRGDMAARGLCDEGICSPRFERHPPLRVTRARRHEDRCV